MIIIIKGLISLNHSCEEVYTLLYTILHRQMKLERTRTRKEKREETYNWHVLTEQDDAKYCSTQAPMH